MHSWEAMVIKTVKSCNATNIFNIRRFNPRCFSENEWYLATCLLYFRFRYKSLYSAPPTFWWIHSNVVRINLVSSGCTWRVFLNIWTHLKLNKEAYSYCRQTSKAIKLCYKIWTSLLIFYAHSHRKGHTLLVVYLLSLSFFIRFFFNKNFKRWSLSFVLL